MGRTPTRYGEDRPYTIKELGVLHQTILNMKLGENGYERPLKHVEIAALLNLSPSHITQIVRSPLFMRELKSREFEKRRNANTVREFMLEYGLEMAQVLIELGMDAKSEQVKLAAATAVLDRIGVEKGIQITKHDGKIKSENWSDEEVRKLIKKRLIRAIEDGAIDAEFEVLNDGRSEA